MIKGQETDKTSNSVILIRGESLFPSEQSSIEGLRFSIEMERNIYFHYYDDDMALRNHVLNRE